MTHHCTDAPCPTCGCCAHCRDDCCARPCPDTACLCNDGPDTSLHHEGCDHTRDPALRRAPQLELGAS